MCDGGESTTRESITSFVKEDTRENKFVSLVVYVHNEEAHMEDFLSRILGYCKERFRQLELICVDDHCTDQSMKRLKEYQKANQSQMQISIVHMSYYQGLEASMNAGRDLAIGDMVFEFDRIRVDYEPALLMRLYERMLEGIDVVTAGQKERNPVTSRLFYLIYNLTSRSKGKIGPETFRIISRRAINRVKSMDEFIPYRKAVYRNCGLKTDRILYRPLEKGEKGSAGHRKAGGKVERTIQAMDSLIYFTNAMERVSLMLSCLFLIITLIVAFYILCDFFSVGAKPIEGWVSTMGFMAFGFLGVFGLLTIILKYLSLILNLIFKKQKYLIENIEKLN